MYATRQAHAALTFTPVGTERKKRPRIAPIGPVHCASSDNYGKEKKAPVSQPVEPVTVIAPHPVGEVTPARRTGRPGRYDHNFQARLMGPVDVEKPTLVFESTNYDQFIIPAFVAEPTEEEVDRMVYRLQQRDMLAQNPITVTPYLEVYDGKVRLAAAKRLQLPVYYLVDPTLSVYEIVTDRGQARGWEYDQYAEYYAQQGRTDYRELWAFSREHKLPLSAAASLLSGGGTQKPNKEKILDFKRGLFRVTNRQHADNVVAILNRSQAVLPSPKAKERELSQQGVFIKALSSHLEKPGVTPELVEGIMGQVQRQPTEADYERHLRRLLRDKAQQQGITLVLN
jgi:hypothetical protein